MTDLKKPGPQRKLNLLDEFFIVLVRLKTGLFLFDLSERFNISVSAISKIFTTWIIFFIMSCHYFSHFHLNS